MKPFRYTGGPQFRNLPGMFRENLSAGPVKRRIAVRRTGGGLQRNATVFLPQRGQMVKRMKRCNSSAALPSERDGF